MSAVFEMSNVKPGQMVMYMTSPSESTAHPMLVVEVEGDAISGVVHWTGQRAGATMPKEGVRHVTDEWLKDERNVAIMIDEDEGGCFFEHPDTVEAREKLDALQLNVDSLEDSLETACAVIAAMQEAIKTIDPKVKLDVKLPAAPKLAKAPKAKAGEEPKAAATAPATGRKLSDMIGGAMPKIDPAAKAAALASA